MEELNRPNVEGLLAEELTPDEVHDLLERLNARDFGGSENATVGAVVEATGTDPLAIGRMLAAIRKEDFEERFGLHLKHHERRIESLEERAKRLEASSRTSERKPFQPPRIDPYQQKALDRLAEEERKRQEMQPVAIVVSIVVGLIFIILLAGQCSPPSRSSILPNDYSVGTVNEGWIEESPTGGIHVREKNGSTRRPTNEEVSIYSSLKSQRR